MLNLLAAVVASLLAASAFAAVDVNSATQAELEEISGIGPALSALIVSERRKGDFADWNDLFARVSGVGDRSAARLSAGGLTVNGRAYRGAPHLERAKGAASAKAASGAAPASATTARGSKPASAALGSGQ